MPPSTGVPGAAGDPVGLAEEQRTGLLLDDAGVDVRECRQLCRERRRSTADDEDVDSRGKMPRRSRTVVMVSRFGMTCSEDDKNWSRQHNTALAG
jgi:hypothetical protein